MANCFNLYSLLIYSLILLLNICAGQGDDGPIVNNEPDLSPSNGGNDNSFWGNIPKYLNGKFGKDIDLISLLYLFTLFIICMVVILNWKYKCCKCNKKSKTSSYDDSDTDLSDNDIERNPLVD